MESITTAELAEVVHADGKKLRKFLREVMPKEQHPGRGNRWELPGGKRSINRLQKQYNEWAAEHTRRMNNA